MDKESLQEIWGVIINMHHNKQDSDDWLTLLEEEQAGLLPSIESLDKHWGFRIKMSWIK